MKSLWLFSSPYILPIRYIANMVKKIKLKVEKLDLDPSKIFVSEIIQSIRMKPRIVPGNRSDFLVFSGDGTQVGNKIIQNWIL